VTTMRFTPYFSRVNANGEFLHNEGMNLPLQEEEYPWEKEGYRKEDAYGLLRKHKMPNPVTYKGDEYYFTGKIGFSSKKPRTLAFEYTDHETKDTKGIEQRLWMNIRGEITPD